jgi:hypothetical protein
MPLRCLDVTRDAYTKGVASSAADDLRHWLLVPITGACMGVHASK